MADDETELRDQYRRERRESALRYQDRDRLGYGKIVLAVMEHYRGEAGGYKARMAEIARRCASANHFPATFEEWRATQPVGASRVLDPHSPQNP